MSEKLKARQLEMLKYLVTSTSPLDIGFFEEKFHKSPRTIRYDMNELKALCETKGAEIRYLTKKGFFIPASQKMVCSEILVEQKSQENTGFLLDSDEERYKKLFLYFFTRTKKVTADQVAEEFFISRSTLLRLLAKMETQFMDSDIRLVNQKSGGYELTADELALRRRASAIVAERFKGSYTPEDWSLLLPDPLKEFINLQTITSITNGIKKINARHNIWISNTAFLNLLSYCLVRNLRFYRIKPEKDAEALLDRVSRYAYDLLREISIPGDAPSVREADYMQEIVGENGVAGRHFGSESDLMKGILLEMMEEMKRELETNLGSFDFEGLFQDLYGHLKNAISFADEEGHQEENYIVIQEIKENCMPFYLEARKCAAFLEERLQAKFTETEICYIAVYLYKNCRERKDSRKNVLIICATGKGLSHLLSIRVARAFPMLNIVGQASPYQLSLNNCWEDVDFIISTTPLSNARVPVVKISRILSQEDIKRIREFLDYGKLIDEIPLKQKDAASFGAKTDPFALAETPQKDYNRQELVYAASMISKLILTLLEYTSKFPERYQMGQDTLLGMIIHMSMAVPRWYESREGSSSEEFNAEYAKIRREHGEIFAIMEKFFQLVESSLQVRIPVEEKTAFFLYIIKED